MNKFYNAELAARAVEADKQDRIAELSAKALRNPEILESLEIEDLVKISQYYDEIIREKEDELARLRNSII